MDFKFVPKSVKYFLCRYVCFCQHIKMLDAEVVSIFMIFYESGKWDSQSHILTDLWSDHSTLRMRIKILLETLVFSALNYLTRPVAQE